MSSDLRPGMSAETGPGMGAELRPGESAGPGGPIRLIAFDLDGTLLDDRKGIPPENIRALEEAADRGIVPVPATGRIVRGIPEAVKRLPGARYFIVSNGAGVYDAREGRLLYRGDVPLELALRCYEYMDTLPVLYDCYQNDMGYMSRWMYDSCAPYFTTEPHMLELIRRLRVPVEDLKETLRQRGEPLQKLQMFFRPEDLPLRERELRRIPELFPELVATTSVSNNIEINSVNAGKGKAMRALAAHLGIRPEETLAFGDGSNDRELLELAGWGVAMANADPAVKAVADEIAASNNEAGVARVIRRILAAQG